MSENYVGLMAKYPEQGKVKTRLAQTIGDENALIVYNKLLQNCITNCIDKEDRFNIIPFITPAEKTLQFQADYSIFREAHAQKGCNLGERMMNALLTLKEVKRADKVLLIGADIPRLDSSIINNAFSHLQTNDIAIGPTTDGGYYLIGMKIVFPEIFDSINYGTEKVLQQTISKAAEAELSYSLLSELSDIDRIEDLKFSEEFKEFLQ